MMPDQDSKSHIPHSPCYGCNPAMPDGEGYWCDFCWHSVIRNLDELEE